MNIKLTPELKSALELRHSKVRDGYERDRIKAVLLHAKGWTIVMIAQSCLFMKAPYHAILVTL